MKTSKLLFFIILSSGLLLYFSGCNREWNNPFDPNNTLDPEAWAPGNLQITVTSITERQLTWTYNGPANIQGFKIDRKKCDDAWQVALATLPKETRTWNDTTLIPQAGLTYQYRIYTYAGSSLSSQIVTSTQAMFPPPSNLTLTKLTDVSYKLEWDDNSKGEQGFKVDRRTGEEDWKTDYVTLDANHYSYIDTNVFLSKNALDVEYRVYGFHGNYISSMIYAGTQAILSSPVNLQLQVNSQNSISISWSYNGSGHQGFKIDRKINEGNWQEESAVVNPSQTSFTDNMVNLGENSYRYRVYAFISSHISDKVENYISKPSISTATAANITGNTAISGGNVSNDGGIPVTARGVCWNNSPNPTTANQKTMDGNGTGNFVSNITGLSMGVTYYVRAYATNAAGTSYGGEISFTTANVPTVTTAAITNITGNSATSGGNVTSDGGLPVTQRGVCWSTSPNPTIANQTTSNGSGTGIYSSTISNLNHNTTYYVRAYATNSSGTSYGNQISFTTLSWTCGTNFTDPRDNKIYGTVQIGTQCWMKQNLNIGSRISGSTGQSNNGVIEKYCYNNSESNCTTYGGLYQWNEMMQYSTTPGVQGICPPGWHIPTDAEWTTLTTYLGGESVAGGKMKEAGTAHWSSPNTGASNSSGFTAFPGGRRNTDGSFYNLSYVGNFWSSSVSVASYAWSQILGYNDAVVIRGGSNKSYGFSVRCLKDN